MNDDGDVWWSMSTTKSSSMTMAGIQNQRGWFEIFTHL